MKAKPTTAQVLAAARRYSRLQAGPLPGVPVEPDSADTIARRISQEQRAAFDLAIALQEVKS